MTRLSVNVNKIALLRNARTIGIPDVVHLSRLAIAAGAAGITVHPRPDQRHIRADDVASLSALVRAHAGVEYNIEGNPFHQLMGLVREFRPDQCTLVPDAPAALTSDHGWDLDRDGDRLRPVIEELRSLGVRVSLFMDPVAAQMPKAKALGADRIELYTEPYAQAHGTADEAASLTGYASAAAAAIRCGLGVNAGHDLNLRNLTAFLAALPGVMEVSIGHALIADALELGMTRAVGAYLDAIKAARLG
jgi:pyridoxine 5-phosphate synthase